MKPKQFYPITLCLLLICSEVFSQIPTNGLVAYYPFSGNANDVSGNSLNGTVSGATLTTDHLGNSNSAYYFDGVNNYIEIPHNNLFNNQVYSVSFWYKFSTAGSSGSGGINVNPALISKVLTTTSTIYDNWVVHEGLSLVAFKAGANANSVNLSSPTQQNNGQWRHMVVTVDVDSVRMFVNGQKVATNLKGTNLTFGNYPIRLGRSNATYWKAFNGSLDELAIYNRVLTQQEVTQIFSGSLPCTIADITTGLVASYPFTGNANDVSGNNNDGTVHGATLTTDRLGNANSAYSFNGSNNYIEVPSSASLNFNTQSLSITAWLKLSAPNTTFNGIVSKMDNAGNGYQLALTNNTLRCEFGDNVGNGVAHLGMQNLFDNAWHNVGWVIDRGNNQSRYYVDGVLDTVVNDADLFLANVDNNATLKIGVERLMQFYYRGALDDIRIYNRILTPCDIDSLTGLVDCSSVTASITNQTATTFCTGGSVTLNASAGSSYAWSGSQTTQGVTTSTGGSYTVTVTDANACTASASVSVTVNALPTATPTTSPSTICNGNSSTLAANATAGSGTISTYAWSSGIGGNAASGSVSPSGNTTYTVTITNSNNCSLSASTSLTVNAKPTVAPNATPSAFCVGGSTTLAANAVAGSGTISTYAWSSGIVGNLSGGSVSPSGNATYNVTVTNSNNCSVTGSVSVTVYPLPTVNFSLPSFINNNASPITLNGSPNGGSYSGVSGISGSTLTPSQTGLGNKLITYSYTNGNNCTNTASANTVVYDTTGVVCTSYDTVTTYLNDTTHVTVYDTTHVSVTDTLVITIATGIAPPNNVNSITVYPNPAHDHLVINNGNLNAMTGYSIKITNALGQIVFNQAVNQPQFYVDVTTWGGSGIYLLYVLDASQNIKSTKQIVLQ